MTEAYITIIKLKAFDREIIDFCISEAPMNKDDVKDFVFKKCHTGFPISSQHFVIKSKETKIYPQPKSEIVINK
jgi:hypothetical protein